MYRSDKGILGLLRHVNRVPVPSIEQAGEELAQQMQRQFTTDPPLNARVRSPNRFLFSMHMRSVLYEVLLPTVRVYAYGDEQIYITAASLLERYVRTPDWYLHGVDARTSVPSSPKTPDEADARLSLLISKGLRSSSPPLESPDERRHANRSGTVPPLVMIDAALVCVRLAMIQVFSDEKIDTRDFYTNLVESLRGGSSGEMDDGAQAWLDDVEIGRLKAREVFVLEALQYRLDVPTLFDMWTVCDQFMWGDDGVAATLNEDERRTLSAFAATLLVYTQSDRRLATSSLWLSAGAICLLVTHAAAVKDAYATRALERIARALAHAVAVREQVDNDSERVFAERLARLIVARANNIRTGFADAARDEQSFTRHFVRNLLREHSEILVDKFVRRFAGTYRRINRPEEIRLPPWLLDRVEDAEEFDSLVPDEKSMWRRVVEETYPERREIDVLALVEYVRRSSDFDVNLLELERAKRDRQTIEQDLFGRDRASTRRRQRLKS